MKKNRLFIFICIGIVIIGLYNLVKMQPQGTILENKKHFKIIKVQDSEYYYAIYNGAGELVKEDNHYRTEPIIDYVDENILEIKLYAGTNIFYCTYYNIQNNEFSEKYENPVAVGYGKIAYLKYEDNFFNLIVRDIWNKDIFYKEFILKDIQVAVSPLKRTLFLDENTVCISYVSKISGEEQTDLLELR